MNNALYYQIALSITPGIGPVKARLLLEHFGNAEDIFKASVKELYRIDDLGKTVANAIKNFTAETVIKEEIAFIEKYQVQPIFISDDSYPKRLLNCYDPPTLLYYKGNANINMPKIISIIGTRTNTLYGKETTEKIVATLAHKNVLLVSGLAAGIDVIAHRAALAHNIPTIGVLGNGLQTVYPAAHKPVAKNMVENGGLLTEFLHNTKPDKHNFPRRNRIVAGLCDAVIVIETSLKGGSMITAEIANSYNRDIFAVPGRVYDAKSEGCNYLIQNNKAMLFKSVEDFLLMMGWDEKEKNKFQKKQAELFYNLSDDERRITTLLQEKDTVHIDDITSALGFTSSKLAALMLQLELQNIIRSLPGKLYSLY